MTDGSPVSLEYEDAGLFFVCMDVVEGGQKKVASVRGWMESWMLLRFCGWMESRTPEEGGINPGLDAVVDAVEAL